VTAVVRELVAAAAASGQIRTAEAGADEATYMILSLKSAFITSHTLGNDSGARLPSVFSLTSFCLAGLGATVDDEWLEAVNAKLRFPERLTLGNRSRRK
jgi:hypothetical protein